MEVLDQDSEVRHLLTQNLSIKEIAAMVGVSEWRVVDIMGKVRKRPRH